MKQEQYTWHFSNGYLANGDGREIVSGMALACNPDEIRLCVRGFHSSRRIIDALWYALGNVISYCAVGGNIIEDDDKLVSSQRRHIHVIDAERILHEFAIWCAEQALALVEDPDPRSVAAIQAKRDWLDGKISDNDLAAARAAAWDAAWAAARAATWAAAWAAARAATWDAAWAAARAAARAATLDATRATQNDKLEQMVFEAIKGNKS